MAIEKNIKINVDTKEAVSDVNKLDKSFKDLDGQTEKTSTGLKDVGENGGAIALLDSVTGGLATRFRDAYEATKLFNFSLKGTRAALIATGIGVFLVSVGLLIAYWDDIVRFITQANEKLEEQNTLIDSQLEITKLSLETNELLEKSLIAQGKSVDEILKVRDKILQSEQLLLVAKLQNLIQQRSLLKSKAEELSFAQRIGEQELKNQGIDIGKSKADISEEDRLALLELDKQITQTNNALINLGITRDALANPDRGKGKDGDKLPEAQEVGDGLNFEDTNTLNSKKLLNEYLNDEDVKLQESQSLRDARRLKDAEIIANYEIYQAEQVKNAKIAIAGQTLNIIGMLAKEGSDLAKGIAASQATINTFLGVTSALSAPSTIPEPFGTILKFANAAAIGVSGAINVKKILATKPVSTTAPSGGAGGRAPAPPSFNLVQGTASNQINDSLQTQEPVRAIVVSRDVTSAQEANRNSENNSTL